jgi:hypothetical protein
MKSLDDLFMLFPRDVYYAERQLLKALPKMAKNAQAPALRDEFTAHLHETVRQVERLEQVFEHLGKPAKGVLCEAIKGLIEETEEVIEASDLWARTPVATRTSSVFCNRRSTRKRWLTRSSTTSPSSRSTKAHRRSRWLRDSAGLRQPLHIG